MDEEKQEQEKPVEEEDPRVEVIEKEIDKKIEKAKVEDPDFKDVLAKLHDRGVRIYYSDEIDTGNLVTMLMGFGLNEKAICRLFDVVIFRNGSMVEFEGFSAEGLVVTNSLFVMGKWIRPKRSVLLGIRPEAK